MPSRLARIDCSISSEPIATTGANALALTLTSYVGEPASCVATRHPAGPDPVR